MFEQYVDQANQRLKSAKTGVTIEIMGRRLCLRGTLPPKPDSQKTKPYQQRLYLGIYANPAGIKKAEAEAKKVGGLLACKEFSWEPYLTERERPKQILIADWVKQFEQSFFSAPSANITSWKKDYEIPFNKLPHDIPISVEILEEVLLTIPQNTRSRKRYSLAYRKLAELAGLDYYPNSGNYSPRKARPREVPEDPLLLKAFKQMQNPAWRWVYGILATYGLRNHEVFHLDLDSLLDEDGIIKVLAGKTGSRTVCPIYPEWVEQFKLREPCVPQVSGKTNSALGARVTQAFKRADMPFAPYDLRHAWAVRSIEFGMDVSLAAQQMGHSLAVHSELYHAWISENRHRKVFHRLMQRKDRPKPPSS